MVDENNPFNDIKTDDIYNEENLLDNNDSKDIKKVCDNIIETINLIDNDVPFVEVDELATDAPKKVKSVANPNRIRLASNRILKKYQKQKQIGNLKKTNKKARKWLKKAVFLETDNYNNDVSINDLETVDFNSDIQMSDVNDIGIKETSATQQTAKKIIKTIETYGEKNLMRK